MGTSYGELAVLEQEFDRQCKKLGVRWVNEEVRLECLNDFINQYEEGNNDPEVMLCGYGYEGIK